MLIKILGLEQSADVIDHVDYVNTLIYVECVDASYNKSPIPIYTLLGMLNMRGAAIIMGPAVWG